MWWMIASSISSPPTRMLWETTMPPSEMTATSVVPPPMSTIMFPVGSLIGRAAPVAAAPASPLPHARRAPAGSAPPSAAGRPPPATPAGTHAPRGGRAHRACRRVDECVPIRAGALTLEPGAIMTPAKPRPRRRQVPGGLYPITAGGSRRQPIFLDSDDHRFHLWCLNEVVAECEWEC